MTEEKKLQRQKAIEKRRARIARLEAEIDPERLEELMYLHETDDGGWDEDEEDYWRNNLRNEAEEKLVEAWDDSSLRGIGYICEDILEMEAERRKRDAV